MTALDLRRGATAGILMSVMAASASGGWSKDQPGAALETLAFGLMATLLAVVIARELSNSAPTTAGSDGRYGGFWIRAVALALDYIPLYVVGFVLALAGLGAVTVPILGGLAFLYFVGLWTTAGATLGMRAMGLRVVDEGGGKLSLVLAVRRFVGLFLALACVFVGVAWVAFDKRKRGWADLLGRSLVVRTTS